MPTQTAAEVAKWLFAYIYRHSCPIRIFTDQGKCFEAELFRELLALLDIDKSGTTPYHPQCDGHMERFNRTLEGMLRCFIQDNLTDWDEYLKPLAFAYNTAMHAMTGVSPFQMLYGRLPRLPIDLIFPSEVKCQFELEPEEFFKEKEHAIRKVFEFVAMIREGNIARHKFLHERKIQGRKFNLMDRVYLKNDKPRVRVSKKLKLKFEVVYTVEGILEATNGEETTEIYKIKPDGRGRTKTVNASKLKKASGPFYRERTVKEKSDVSRHMVEAIERELDEGHIPEITSSEEINERGRVEDDNIHKEVDKIIEMINNDGVIESDRELEDMQGLELSWEEDPEFAVEVTVENDEDYQPNYYFQKKLAAAPVEKSPRPQRNRRKPDRLTYA